MAELRREHPDAEVTVIVDATFAHRIDPSELERFETAALRGEYAHPPAGAIGRGDAFLLRVAEKVDGTVLSNDSFQEFHGEHPWLFERGRLLGATPLPGIGWIFTPRQPVRGPRSRQAVRETTQAKKRVSKALAVATKEVVEPPAQDGSAAAGVGRSRRNRGAGGTGAPAPAPGPRPLAVNDPLAFVSFIAAHPLGDELEGEVEGYTSHGAVVTVGEMRCYVPLANLGHPPPRSAREILKRNEQRTFVLTALDPQRRGAELALPGVAVVSGRPLEETVEAEVKLSRPPRRRSTSPDRARVADLGPPPVPTAATPPPGRRSPRAAAATASGVATGRRATKAASPAKKTSKTAPGAKKAAAPQAAPAKPAVRKAAAKAPAATKPASSGPRGAARGTAPAKAKKTSGVGPPKARRKPVAAVDPVTAAPATGRRPARHSGAKVESPTAGRMGRAEPAEPQRAGSIAPTGRSTSKSAR